MHTVILKSKALRFIRNQSKKIQGQLLDAIDTLKTNPLAEQSTTLKGKPEFRRIRSGEYRIVYYVVPDQPKVLVLRIGNRRDVYDRVEQIKVPRS